MFRSLISAILLVVVLFGMAHTKKAADLVLTLTKENFTTTIAEYEFVLVNFYAPWCGHCKALSPEFQKAAEEMVKTNALIKFAKVDATENDELAYEQQVRAYPTLRFFHNTKPVQYTGGNEAEDIIAWVKKELKPPVKQLKSIRGVKKFLTAHPTAVIGFFCDQETESAKVFNEVAAEMKDFVFGVTFKDNVIADFELIADSIVLFKPYDEEKVIFKGPYEREALKRFIELQSLPLIMEFEHATASKILRGPTKAILLFFISEDDEQLGTCVEPLRELAKTYRDHVLFVTVTYDDKDKKRAFEYFGITKNETPTIRLIQINEKDELVKYKPDNHEISVKVVDDFIQQYIEGCLCRHYVSQTLPDDWDEHPVVTLVASNFYNVAYDEQRSVLVEFYAPWCGHCKQLEPILQQLAEKYIDNDEIVIAKINGVLNEVENLKVTAFPTIKLFLKDSNEMISYNGARSLEGLEQFLQKYGIYRCEKDEL